MACRNLCQRNEVREQYGAIHLLGAHFRWRDGGPRPYDKGRKGCKVCEWSIAYEGWRCPCCSHTMRTGCRSGQSRKKRVDALERVQ